MEIVDLHGRTLPVFSFDAETYYEMGRGAKITLSKMSTTEYVRSPKFKVHGASVRMPGDDNIFWVSGCDLNDVLSEIDWPNTALLCQNTAFDGFILSQKYNRVPGYYLDTLSMSRGEWGVGKPHNLSQIGERLKLGRKIEGALEKTAWIYNLPWALEKALIPYANRDVELMDDIFRALIDLKYPREELHIIDMTLRAFCDPKLHIDAALCLEEASEEAAIKSKLAAHAGATAAQLLSNPQFAQLLEARGVTPPTKTSPTTGARTYAFSKADLDFQKLEQDPRVADLILARKRVKSTINETRAHRFLSHGRPTLPVPLQYCGAHTHRWSAWDKINMQNLPSGRNGQSDRLRRAIIAPPGKVIVVVDSSQIEARTNAWAAGEESLLRTFREGGDPYAETASEIYGYPVNKREHKTERQLGKVAELMLGYGAGWRKFAYTVRAGMMGPPIDITDALAIKAVNTYRTKRKGIPALWDDLEGALSRMEDGEHFEFGPWEFYGSNVLLPNKLFMRFDGLYSEQDDEGRRHFSYKARNGVTNIYGGKFCENLIQSTARTVVAMQALELAKRYPDVVLLVHDEVVYLADEDDADDALQFGIDCLREPPSFCPDLPVDAEGGFARNYSK